MYNFHGDYPPKQKFKHPICLLVSFIMHEYTLTCLINVRIIGIGLVVYLLFRNFIVKTNVLLGASLQKLIPLLETSLIKCGS